MTSAIQGRMITGCFPGILTCTDRELVQRREGEFPGGVQANVLSAVNLISSSSAVFQKGSGGILAASFTQRE